MLFLHHLPDASAGSTIIIGDNIEVSVLEVQADRIRLGIAAPRGLPTHRWQAWAVLRPAPNTGGGSDARQDTGVFS